MKFRFPIVIIDEDFRSENASGLGIRALADAIEKEGVEILGVTSYHDLSQFAQQQSRASAFILSIDDEEFGLGSKKEIEDALQNLNNFVQEIRFKNAEIPIYLYGETRTSRHIPNAILKELHGFIHMFEDTPEFVARHIIREAKSYLDSLAPPFFRALVHYAQDGSYSWHCPGHSGGVAFLKSPVGQMFHQFFGENMLRADVCNAVDELGQLLDHTGPVAASERNAARIFNADHCFFVTNGTSTSNKMVWHANVAPGDIVVVDRNCHKSILHSITMTGAIPVFLTPTRNHLGIIGPDVLSEEGMSPRDDWLIHTTDTWHGFGKMANGFNMLDPIKATIVNPGLDVNGQFSDAGIPASIVTKYLAEHGVIVEKTGLYSFFIMFTIGITKGRWNTLVTALQQFKDDYDKNQPLWRVIPEFCQAYPRYETVGLRDLCNTIHDMYRKKDVARLTTEMYLSDMQPAMVPADAYAKVAHREIERVAIDELEGRITSALLTPYPPGIPLLIPGEIFNATIVDYLKFARDFNKQFPGFETDIHGLVEIEDEQGNVTYFVDCVKA